MATARTTIAEAAARLATRSLAQRTREKRAELMVTELEAVALALFDEHGFPNVTVEEIATTAEISTRTFYRYFSSKEDVLLVRIHRRADALKSALAERPADEPPLHSLRLAIEAALSKEDPEQLERWMTVVAATPEVTRTALGACILLINGMLAEFFGARMNLPSDGLVPSMLAAAASGVIEAAQLRWRFLGGELATTVSEGVRVLEDAVGSGSGK